MSFREKQYFPILFKDDIQLSLGSNVRDVSGRNIRNLPAGNVRNIGKSSKDLFGSNDQNFLGLKLKVSSILNG